MSDENRTQLLFIISKNGEGSIYDFNITFDDGIIQCKNNNETIKISLQNACINRSWYSVNSTNNTFKIRTFIFVQTYTIPSGYYDVYTFRTCLLGLLGSAWTITYNAVTNSYTFFNTTLTIGQIYWFDFVNNCNILFGFDQTSPIGDNVTPITSTRPVMLNHESSVIIHCQGVSRLPNSCIDNFSTNIIESDILGKVDIDVVPYGNIIYNSLNNEYSFLLSDKSIKFLRFYVTSESNKQIELLHDYTMVLKIEYVKNDNDKSLESINQIRDYLQLIVLNDHMLK